MSLHVFQDGLEHHLEEIIVLEEIFRNSLCRCPPRIGFLKKKEKAGGGGSPKGKNEFFTLTFIYIVFH